MRLRFLIFHSFHSSAYKFTKQCRLKGKHHDNVICPSNLALIVLWFLIFTIDSRSQVTVSNLIFSSFLFSQCCPEPQTQIRFNFSFLVQSSVVPTHFIGHILIFRVNIFGFFLHLDLHFVMVLLFFMIPQTWNWFVGIFFYVNWCSWRKFVTFNNSAR